MRHWIVNSALCAVAVSAVLACGDDVMKMAGRVMTDAGRRMQRLDASISDASAQSGSDASTVQPGTGMPSQCGACVVSDPIAIKGPVKVITADTDPAQLVSGSADVSGPSTWQELEAGPLIITDLLFAVANGAQVSFAIASAGKCGSKRDPLALLDLDRVISIQGARLPIKQGQVLCAMSDALNGVVRWSGFRPYE